MSLSKLIDSSKKIFEINNEIISFNINQDNFESSSEYIAIGEEEISITNVTQDYLALRAKSTKATIYAVNPSHFILSPNEIKKIKIIVYKVPGGMDTKDHKFRFEGFIIKENEKDKDVKQLFSDYIEKGDKIEGNIIKRNVKYIYDKDNKKNSEDDKKETVQEEKVENLKKEEIQSKKENPNQNINNDNKHKNNSDKNKENKELDINKDMSKYLFIGLFVISLITIYFLFK